MTEHDKGSPYLYTIQGRVNGEPHEIVMDVKEQIERRAESNGLVLTDAELHEQSMQLIRDMERTREAVQQPSVSSRESRVQKVATRVTTLFSRQ